ncbi:hypothetical protein [Legionella feeleii]|uniref:Uncharacterized protein n=1 Tax=Legionella feeleii TaxID=453 RepID=A0A0W0TEY5_9GAMM|nr:hypothetical protein [Legionella feeleii]KTC94029.1 hypothetical protein Lfee_3266 [Legionella feeleii]SPX59853.1 Uncharacterised protein [Legionella feeleii]
MKLPFSEFSFEELCTILYKENAQEFLKVESSANDEQIQKDLNRTPFLSRDCPRQDMLDYLEKVLNPSSFIQGSITGAFFTSAFKNNITRELQEDIDKLEEFQNHHSKLDFFYMSNTSNKKFGFSLFSFENNWVICVADVENNKFYLSASPSLLESFKKLQNHSKKEEQFLLDKDMTQVIDFIFDKKNDSISPAKVTMLSRSFSTSDNNCDILRYINDGAPLQLLPSQVIDAELKYLDSKGFNIESKACRTSFIEEEEGFELLIDKEEGGSLTNEEEKPSTSFEEKEQTEANLFFVCTHEQSKSKVVLFSPSTDISPQDVNEKTIGSSQYLLHTQVIAEKYINKGYTCILPVLEYADVTITGYSATSRRHHVMLAWSKDELGFFDPKSGKIGGLLPKIIGGYSNEVFKSFANKAGYHVENATEKTLKKAWSFFGSSESNKTYESIKEPKVQETLDFNNCGYFCIYRFKALIDALVNKNNKPILNSRIDPGNIKNVLRDLVDEISLEIAKENKNGFNHYKESFDNSFSEINKNPGAWAEVGKLKAPEGYQKTKDGAAYTEVSLSELSFKLLSAKEIEEIRSKYKGIEELNIGSQFLP